ncbi:unnamed protein product [Cuscuta epithymum]|uniref:Remorin C-terminal domain-containing protein n=1 Tax=Cuscuta epithymum TaxID=186058 RepID=A0AAV0GD68_9ASTE|nr:unnamed protein product [Cuscuta epithymum]
MECYERIEKPNTCTGQLQLSPRKLRSMLSRTQKRKKPQAEEQEEEEDPELGTSLRSESEIHDSEVSSEICKDVAVVSVLNECSTEWGFGSSMVKDNRLKDQSQATSMFRPQDVNFEFQKADRAQRVPPGVPFSKPAPSKWDDAQKWIASPTSNRQRTQCGLGSRKSTKHVSDISDRRTVISEEPADTKWIDSNQFKENGVQKYVSWESESHPVAESYGKETLVMENCIRESAINLSQHDSCVSVHSETAFVPLPSTARSVSMRDMGTEMTPLASQEPSRTGTPVRATTPTCSPTSTPPCSSTLLDHSNDPQAKELFEKELQMKTRKEIMALGTQLGKMNIAAWASNEEGDDKNGPTVGAEQPDIAIMARAAAWEEAENAKHLARFKREEMKIQAWENHQIAKAEAEMRKIEMEVERMRTRSQDEVMKKLSSVRCKAEEKRASAEAKMKDHSSKAEKQAEYIRRTGRIPTSSACCCLRWRFF